MDLQSEREKINSSLNDGLDNLLSSKIGYGKAQDTLTLPINILLFTEGCESVAIGLLLPELQRQWNITTFEKSLLITMVYLGVSIGSYLQSFSDNIGRSVFIKWNAILQLIFGVLSCIATSIDTFIFYRFIYGIGIGIVLPLSATYMSQITPNQNRAIILTKSRAYWSSGCLITCILVWGFLYTHRWRTLLFVICIPGVYALWQQIRAGKQSLRYLWVKKRTDQVVELINYMTLLNGRDPIAREQIEYLIEVKEQQIKQSSFKELINQKYKKMTLILIIAWFSVCFIFYGILLLLPTILSKNTATSYNFKYASLIVISIVELICFYFSKSVMDHPDFGRKKSSYIGFGTVGICCMLLMTIDERQTYLLLGMFLLIKIFITTTFMVIFILCKTLYPYSAQIYNTLIRSKAMGVFSLSGRIATTALGFLGVNALQWMDGKGLYLIFLIVSFMSSFLIFKMPYCTLGRALDS